MRERGRLTDAVTCVTSAVCDHLKRFVSTVGQHVSLQPALAGGWRVVDFAALPQTHKHLWAQTQRHITAAELELHTNMHRALVPTSDQVYTSDNETVPSLQALPYKAP